MQNPCAKQFISDNEKKGWKTELSLPLALSTFSAAFISNLRGAYKILSLAYDEVTK